ncbi:MAG TPA: hypothetical protein VH325_12395 [Bryobacteraceae bacterium]|jgi:hypothetical protein|nr:hypothetical protein [Bryobacteraceae bacterium]
MNLEFRATRPDEMAEVKGFLQRVFAAPDTSLFIDDANLRWKYYQPREDFSGSRSFVYTKAGRIMAHACAWPLRFLWGGTTVSGVHPIDWAATSEIPAVGALLLRQMRTLADVSFCVGGTDVAQKVIAQSGFRPIGEMQFFSRPLRPFRQLLTHQRRNFKLPARWLRNLVWTKRYGRAVPKGWTASQIDPQGLPREVLPAENNEVLVPERNTDQFRYLASCPVARFALFLVKQQAVPRGYFLLSFTPGQARVADAWIIGGSEAWKVLYRLAVAAAFENASIAEITAASCLNVGQRALEQIGFRRHRTLPIMLSDPKKRLAGTPIPHLQLIDSDFAFWHPGRPDYET